MKKFVNLNGEFLTENLYIFLQCPPSFLVPASFFAFRPSNDAAEILDKKAEPPG